MRLLFDSEWYCSRYDVPDTFKRDPLKHYLELGILSGNNPHPLFQTDFYLSQAGRNLEIENPVEHFLKIGVHAQFSPHPLFSIRWYLATYKDVADSGINPLIHYLKYGASEGRNPSEQFDQTWYLSEYKDVIENGMNALVHYCLYGRNEGRYQNPLEKFSKENPFST